ncbi:MULTISPECIES: nitroreductase family protein [unclassified Carboxylicivirga]|uniref:nitroreductase family protein n=1 Tax=Carboxylicivirga TaxID=1628153 RepID=UPI003D32C4E3
MIEIDMTQCRKCKKCELICPVAGININKQTISNDCIECHHCGAICPHDAINAQHLIGETSQNNIQPYDFELLMQQRRSHRIFSKRRVAPELLQHFIESMRFSPTASNLQSLQFTVVSNTSVMDEINTLTITTLTKAFKGINSFTQPLIRLFAGGATLKKMMTAKDKFMNKAAINKKMITYNAPAMIVIHSETTPVGMPVHDAAIWTGMATLYAELLDLCTCINGYIVNAARRNKKIKHSLQIPAHHTIHSAILIGYPQMKFENRVERNMPTINHIVQ